MRGLLRAAALAAALSFSHPALAEDVTLTARGGGLSVSGRLIGHDGTVYRLATRWGRLTVDAAAVDCAGPGCPDLTRFAPELRIAVEPWLAERLLAPLAESFARAEGLLLSREGDVLELARDGRAELRLRLVAAGEEADAALAHPAPGRAAGPLVARLPLVAVSAPDAPPGPLTLPALRQQRARGGDWPGAAQPMVWHQGGPTLARATEAALGPVRDARSATTPEALAGALRRDPWGIALLPGVPEGLVPRALTGGCGLRSDLSDFAAAAGEHPLTAAIHWTETGHRLPPAARAFAAHLTSPPAQRALAAAGVPAPSPLLRRRLEDQGIRLANALADRNGELTLADLRALLARLQGAERLAPSFRFEPRGPALDAASRAALAQLSAHLASGALRGHEVMLLGFTDAQGPAAANRDLARRRAETVLAILRAETPDLPEDTILTAEGIGEPMPLICDDTTEGRALNRRVEVWIRPR